MEKEDKKRAAKRHQSEAAEARAQQEEMRRQVGLAPAGQQKRL